MDDTNDADSADSVSILVASPPERCYEIVADITHMGRLSPECTGGRWIGSPKTAAPGARFVGFKAHDDEVLSGMRESLERLKSIAETR